MHLDHSIDLDAMSRADQDTMVINISQLVNISEIFKTMLMLQAENVIGKCWYKLQQ